MKILKDLFLLLVSIVLTPLYPDNKHFFIILLYIVALLFVLDKMRGVIGVPRTDAPDIKKTFSQNSGVI
jgi:hypothetical protein